MVFRLILLLSPMARKIWIKNNLHFTFWDRISLEFVSTNPPFFPLLSTPRFKQLLFSGSSSKNPKILKCKSFDVYFSICRSQDRAIIQPKFIYLLSDILFKFRNSSLLSTCLKTFVTIIKKNPVCLNDLVNSRQPGNNGEKNSSTQKRLI